MPPSTTLLRSLVDLHADAGDEVPGNGRRLLRRLHGRVIQENLC